MAIGDLISGEDLKNGVLTKGKKLPPIMIMELVTTYGLQPNNSILRPIPPPDVQRCMDALEEEEHKLRERKHGPSLIFDDRNDWERICQNVKSYLYDLRKYEHWHNELMATIFALQRYIESCRQRSGETNSWLNFSFDQRHDGEGFSENFQKREIEKLASVDVLYRCDEVERALAREVLKTKGAAERKAPQNATSARHLAMIECAKRLWSKPGPNGRFFTCAEICKRPEMIEVAKLKSGKVVKQDCIWKIIKHLNPDSSPGNRPKVPATSR